ncbi:hypothetical protein F5882DRAFT_491187 [Hyaloscypha sp. PMI_1271]|nr:hypothetical protein F5882DRAFT_491187 [Hyaloscypha sp. PMI_1271]
MSREPSTSAGQPTLQPDGFADYQFVWSRGKRLHVDEIQVDDTPAPDPSAAIGDADDDRPIFNSKFEDIKELREDGDILAVTRNVNQHRPAQRLKRPFDEYSLLLRRIIDARDASPLRVQLEVQSDTLRREFRALARALTSISLNRDPIVIPEPFQELHYCRENIEEAIKKASTKEIRRELQLLVDFQERYMSQTIETIRSFNESGTIDFEFLWSIFKPGKHVVIQNSSAAGAPIEWLALLKSFRVESSGGLRTWTVNVAHTGFNGQRFGLVQSNFSFPSFTETISITRLPVYPLEFCKHGAELRAAAITRGKLYERYCIDSSKSSKSPIGTPMMYNGPFWTMREDDNRRGCRIHDNPSSTTNGRVVVDVEGFLSQNPIFRDTLLLEPKAVGDTEDTEDTDSSSEGSFHYHHRMQLRRVATSGLASNVEAQLPRKPLVPDQHETCPPFVPAFSFTVRCWGMVLIDQLSKIEWNRDVFNKLQVDDGIKNTIRVLVDGHSAQSTDFDDFIQGKGRGLVFLLHGPPGCGKTMTAESIAESLKRLLYNVSCGELGTSPTSIQSRLEQAFEVASRWDAIFLLDEADAFLAERRGDSVERNAIISGKWAKQIETVFLRLLEYQSGIIFLTTNRLVDFDKAFHSRIHISISFADLSLEKRQLIWQNLAEAKCSYILSDEEAAALGRIPVDGRTIKNVLRMASLIAKTRTEEDGEMHFSDIVAVLPLAIDGTAQGKLADGQKETDRDSARTRQLSEALQQFMTKFGSVTLPSPALSVLQAG